MCVNAGKASKKANSPQLKDFCLIGTIQKAF